MSIGGSEALTRRRRTREIARAAALAVAAVLLWVLVAGLLGTWEPGVALAWVYLAPLAAAGYVYRRGVHATLAGFSNALRADPADLLALLAGSTLLVPAIRGVAGVEYPIAVITAVALWLLGMLVIGNHKRLREVFPVSPVDWRDRPREAWFIYILSAFLRSPSALATIYLTMAAVSTSTAPSWAPTVAAVVAALIYSLLGVCGGWLPRTPIAGKKRFGKSPFEAGTSSSDV